MKIQRSKNKQLLYTSERMLYTNMQKLISESETFEKNKTSHIFVIPLDGAVLLFVNHYTLRAQ